MKKTILTSLILLSTFGFAQQLINLNLLVMDSMGNPIANAPVVVNDWNPPNTYTYTYLTDINGMVVDSLGTQGAGSLMFVASTAMCTDSSYFPYSPNLGTVVTVYDTLVLCGSGGGGQGNCNFAFGASPSVMNPNAYNFWHQYSSGNPGGMPNSIVWNFGDGTSSTQNMPSHIYSNPGTYVYCVTIDSCPTVCDTLIVGSGGNPNCNASYIVDTVNSQLGTVILWNNSTPAYTQGSGITYYWSFGDGNTSNLPFPIHSYSGPGTYAVCITITVPTGTQTCTSTFCDTLTVDSLGNLIYKDLNGFVLKVLDPNSISVEEEDLSAARLYPNPVKDVMSIEIPLTQANPIDLELFSLAGSRVWSEDREGNPGMNKVELDLSEMVPGIYFLNIRTGQAQKQIKVIKL